MCFNLRGARSRGRVFSLNLFTKQAFCLVLFSKICWEVKCPTLYYSPSYSFSKRHPLQFYLTSQYWKHNGNNNSNNFINNHNLNNLNPSYSFPNQNPPQPNLTFQYCKLNDNSIGDISSSQGQNNNNFKIIMKIIYLFYWFFLSWKI
jgi:hypothetical protein